MELVHQSTGKTRCLRTGLSFSSADMTGGACQKSMSFYGLLQIFALPSINRDPIARFGTGLKGVLAIARSIR